MKDNYITVEKLSKKHHRKDILEDVYLNIRENSITSLFGLNGEGKTTLIKAITGLTKYKGKIEVDNSCKSVGALIEMPSLYKYLSAYDNLKYQALLLGKKINRETIIELLNDVGLEKNEKIKVKKFSLGMRQRLGLAKTLVGNPELIIWDEPFNGLDPVGIEEVKRIIVKLKDRGKTVLISSHMIADTVEISTDCIVLKDGNIKAVFRSLNEGNKEKNEIRRLVEKNL